MYFPAFSAQYLVFFFPRSRVFVFVLRGVGWGSAEHRVQGIQFYGDVTGRDVSSSKELTKREASKVIDALQDMADQLNSSEKS